MTTAIQFIDGYNNVLGAIQSWAFQQTQDGYHFGRLLLGKGEGYRVQTFYEDDCITDDWLPDGMRRVTLTGSLAKQFTA